MPKLRAHLLHLENVVHHQFVALSIAVLRIAVGAVFLGFGVLNISPASARRRT